MSLFQCGWTALMWACYKGRENVVHELLDRGANPNVKAEISMTCLAWAAGRGYTEIVKALLQKGAKVNITDKYGTTPLIWACRKGALEIVKLLLKEGASVDVTGMNSLTALLVATKGGFTEVVQALLEQDNNVNATDKDGLTSLCIAAKEGFAEIVQELLAKDAYVNVADKAGDTILIHAVKSGYMDVVRALLNKYADVNVEGAEGKTALYWAVEKNHIDIVKLLLDSDPDLEICTKDGDTPLLRAVRSRNELCVRLFLDKGARVSAVDKKGDTALHISLRARSKRITELLLRNPRNSRLLYKPNKAGETPYSIDAFHQNQILAQIHGHRKLNANDGENLLGYDIYSSALADILSEPTLNTPITVGLYAKWGSGKSFLLGKLQNEMKSFTQMNTEDQFSFTFVLFIFLLFLNCLIGFTLALSVSWELGLSLGLGLFVFQYGFLGLVWVCSQRYDVRIAIRLSKAISRKLLLLTLLLKVLFTNPNSRASHHLSSVPTVKFLFSESTKLTSVGGEKALAAMVASLGEAVEEEFGFLVTRLFPVFKPNLEKTHSGRFKMLCCVPSFIIVIVVILCIMTGITLFVKYNDIVVLNNSANLNNSTSIKASDPYSNTALNVTMVTLACIVGLSVLTHIYTWGQAVLALMVSQKKRVMKAAEQIDLLKMDGFMQKLKTEVNLMNKMVTCLDEFTKSTTRLVVVVDGLDSCEQEKIVQVLDIIQALHNEERSPFITILAVDPQVIIKGIDHNLKAAFHDTSVNGFDYLRNIVHLPFYLQSQGIRVQKEDITKSISTYETTAGQSHGMENSPMRNYKHQDSTVSAISGFSLTESFSKKSYRKRKPRLDSIAAPTSSFDLSHALTKNDYFSDINPKSVRRLMNIVAVTGNNKWLNIPSCDIGITVAVK
ncbi:hypothetical protein CHS0354_014082 [Potamilus streckersoni]|uniref:KAP NTPase domain-containing protein n=1 Tax=Potamilus streckersoni TaxID=2493646 RepID=A0AAE0RMF2_9BIVA|nr:hypothetical protein CHS0354_014082 [Potamilus streckersoni]